MAALAAAVAADAGTVARAGESPRRGFDSSSPHTVAVTVRGPMALVEVTRVVTPNGGPAREGQTPPPAGRETLLDIDLPRQAVLLDVELGTSVGGAGGARPDSPRPAARRWASAAAMDAAKALGSYRASLQTAGVDVLAEPYDEHTDYRIRVLPNAAGEPAVIRYRFSALLEESGGRYRLRFPPAVDRSPIGADVAVTLHAPDGVAVDDVEIAGIRTSFPKGARKATVTGNSTESSGWEISFSAGVTDGRAVTTPAAALTGLGAIAGLGGREAIAAVTVRGGRAAETALPDRVLLVIDRSRSVDLAGLAAERDLARRLLERLPPSVHFDALFFAREPKRLFPAPRSATLEALEAIDDEMLPAQLANGSDLEGALRAAGDLLRRDKGAFGPRALLVIITDGAIPEDQTGAALDAALGPVAGIDLQVAALSIRPPHDDTPADAARRALRALAESRGGVELEVQASTDRIEAAVGAALASLQRGGDTFSVRLEPGIGSAASGGRHLTAALPAGASASGAVRIGGGRSDGRYSLSAKWRGQTIHTPLPTLPAPASWLLPHAARRGPALDARLAASSAGVVLVEPVARPPSAAAAGPVGRMDRTVIRNTLSLAFMPRARACYQNRPVGTPADRQLSGRVRIEIDLGRGEVLGAGIAFSTLGRPDIERCLREAAFAIEVPRVYRSDAPATAVLNLLFQPRSTERPRQPADDAVFGAEIDLILEQLPPDLDLRDILLTSPPPAAAIPPPPPPAPPKPALPAVPQIFE